MFSQPKFKFMLWRRPTKSTWLFICIATYGHEKKKLLGGNKHAATFKDNCYCMFTSFPSNSCWPHKAHSYILLLLGFWTVWKSSACTFFFKNKLQKEVNRVRCLKHKLFKYSTCCRLRLWKSLFKYTWRKQCADMCFLQNITKLPLRKCFTLHRSVRKTCTVDGNSVNHNANIKTSPNGFGKLYYWLP